MDIFSGVFANFVYSLLVRSMKIIGIGRTRYIDLCIPPTDMPLESFHVNIDQEISPHADFVIRGGAHELKQDIEFRLELPARTTRLVIAGWGVIAGKKRYHGSLSDSGTIGTVVFHDDRNRLKQTRDISLPNSAGNDHLIFADANPVISGYPPQQQVRKMGFLKRESVPVKSTARVFWETANVWISELKVPQHARSITFRPSRGSINLIHVRAVCRYRFIDTLETAKRSPDGAAAPSPGFPDIERQSYLAEADQCLAQAEASYAKERYQEAMASFSKAAQLHLTIGYWPGAEVGRGPELIKASKYYSRAATTAERISHSLLTASYNVNAFFALEQAEADRDEDLIEKTLESLEAVVDIFRSKHSIDILYKAWLSAGAICIESARDPKLQHKRVSYFERAYHYYVDDIVVSVLETGLPSYPKLKLALERLHILKDEYRKLEIVNPDLLTQIDSYIKTVNGRLAEHHGNLVITPDK